MLKLIERCCLFFCLPVTEEEFNNNRENPVKDFVYTFIHDPELQRSWFDYNEQVSVPFIKFSEYFSRAGLMIINKGTYSDFLKLVNSKIADVIILLTHCKEGGYPSQEAIEFYDRMVLSEEILSADLNNYPLVLDISVCRPQYLSSKMQHYHPGFACFTSNDEKDLSIWLYIYGLIFNEMHNQGIGFLEAYKNIFKQLNK